MESNAGILSDVGSGFSWSVRLILDLVGVIKRQEEEIRRLRSLVGQNSENSHRPPSTDFGRKKRKKKGTRKSGRRPGGQPGHQGKTRELVPEDQVEECHDILPERCRCCSRRLKGTDANPIRHQVWELPPIVPFVVEYRLHELVCDCGAKTRAQLPADVSSGSFGPRVASLVGLFTGPYRLSTRNAQRLFADLFGLEMSLGVICDLRLRTGEALEEPVEEVAGAVKEARFINIDETGWREKGKKGYLWAALTSSCALFRIAGTRNGGIAREMLGLDPVMVGSDRYSGYAWIRPEHRQACLSHLQRDFRGMATLGGDAEEIGEALDRQTTHLFSNWHRYKRGEIDREKLKRLCAPIESEIPRLLLRGLSVSEISRKCMKILEIRKALFNFIHKEGIEPTNNRAEQALRQAVIWRKTSFGTWSAAGSRFAERILTVIETLRVQGRSLMAYLYEVGKAVVTRGSAPSLLSELQPARICAA